MYNLLPCTGLRIFYRRFIYADEELKHTWGTQKGIMLSLILSPFIPRQCNYLHHSVGTVVARISKSAIFHSYYHNQNFMTLHQRMMSLYPSFLPAHLLIFHLNTLAASPCAFYIVGGQSHSFLVSLSSSKIVHPDNSNVTQPHHLRLR